MNNNNNSDGNSDADGHILWSINCKSQEKINEKCANKF